MLTPRRLLIATAAACCLVPAPGRAQEPAQQPAAQAATDEPAVPISSWTSDRRRFAVGDVITVLVDEYTIASADRSNTDSQDRSMQGSLAAGGGMRGGTTTGADAAVRTGMAADSRERGQARRSERMSTEVSVRVVAVEPNGMLRVEGRRELVIDKQQQTLTVAGIVRPNDVTPRNVVESWRLSDARVAYTSKGSMGKPKRSIFGRIIGIIWP